MIFGDLTSWEQEKHLYPAAVQRGVEYLRSHRFETMEPGKYEIEGELMFAMVQEFNTAPFEERRPESHRVHTDIQFLVSGEEKIGVSRWSAELPVSENLFDKSDIAFYEKVDAESELVFKPGQFAVFYPSDIHRPGCQVNASVPIRKVVIKIHKQLLQG